MDEEQKNRIRERFQNNPPYLWRGWHEVLLEFAPEFVDHYGAAFHDVPWGRGALSVKEKEFIWTAVDVATTHLFESGARIHIERAISEGVSKEEILEVFHITAQLGLQTYQIGAPLLKQALIQNGLMPPVDDAARHEALKARWIEQIGYWTEEWQDLLDLSPETFETTLNYAAIPWTTGPIEPRVKALIWIAVNASTTHLHGPSVKLGIEMALRHGATPIQLIETLELVAVLGSHTYPLAIPLLMKALGREMPVV